MEVFFQKYIAKITEKSLLDSQGHRIWQGCVKKGPIGYGVIKAQFPNAEWHTLHVHKLAYLVHTRILAVGPGLEVSHLCHMPLCVNIEHLSLEPHNVNTERQKCKNRGECCGHGVYNDCLFLQSKFS